MRTNRTLAIAIAAFLFGQPVAASDLNAELGFEFAQENCSKCHAIESTGESPLALAPPLRTLHEQYPVEFLEEAFAEGIVTGHPSMPEFQLDGAQIDNLIEYLKTLE